MLSHPVCTAIEAIDLIPVCMRLMHPQAGPGWSEQRTRQAERDYREFLFVASQFPDQAPRPTPDVDAFWHFHILDTIKYAKDCAQAFGYFLHHGPDPLPVTVRDWRAKLSATRLTVPVGPTAARGKAANMEVWCSLAQPESEASWSSLAKAEKQASWCSLAQEEKQASWCSLAQEENTSAWCSLARPVAEPVLSAQLAQTAVHARQ